MILYELGGIDMNNLKQIRELFGFTQDEVANALEVTRVAVSRWENDNEPKISNTNMEKLSLLYGVGPEYIIGDPLSEEVKHIIRNKGNRIRETEAKDSNNVKYYDVIKNITNIDKKELMVQYMVSTKLLLVKSEELSLEELEDIIQVNKKLGHRLENIYELKKKSDVHDDDSLFINEIINKYDSNK